MHDIEIVIDRLKIDTTSAATSRLSESINTAMYHGENVLMVIEEDSKEVRYFSRNLMCSTSGISYPKPEPNSFSFNSPKGMCPDCKGLGVQHKVNLKKIIPDENLSIAQGGLTPLGTKKNSWTYRQIETIAKCYDFSLTDTIKTIPPKAMQIILKGSQEKFKIPSTSLGLTRTYKIDFEGLENYLESSYEEAATASIKRWAASYMDSYNCTTCNGSRLKKEALHFKLNNKTISDLVSMDLKDCLLYTSDAADE